jgi:hypothetical protein
MRGKVFISSDQMKKTKEEEEEGKEKWRRLERR